MTRKVFCERNKEELEGMVFAPYPNALGERIFHHISQQAWEDWLKHQTMLINEYRLNITENKAKSFLMDTAEKYLFEGETATPPDYEAEA